MTLRLELLSVNVATPRVLGEVHGEEVLSAIDKRPVGLPSVMVRELNIDGDAQSDLVHHGGRDKAVYAYPADHWDWWTTEHNFPCKPGSFGENLTLKGADETLVAIGDRFSWGEAVLQIAQPRVPCFKFQLYTGEDAAGAWMMTSRRSGWYFRVVVEGAAPTDHASLERIADGEGPTVRETFCAAFDPRIPKSRRQAISKVPSLSEAWRKRLLSGAV